MYLFFAIWFTAGIMMLLQLYPLDNTVADRWFYIPIVGLLGIIGTVLHTIKIPAKYASIAAVIIIIAFSLRSVIRNKDYADYITLFLHDSKIQTNEITEDNLGIAYTYSQQYKQSLLHFHKSLKSYPNEVTAFNIAMSYAAINDFPNSELYLRRIISSQYLTYDSQEHASTLRRAYENLGTILARTVLLTRVCTQNTKTFLLSELQRYPTSTILQADSILCNNVSHIKSKAIKTMK
jgi:tetratricopeptide (TPR) repeat protein